MTLSVSLLRKMAAFTLTLPMALLFRVGLMPWQCVYMAPQTAAYLRCSFDCSGSLFPVDIAAYLSSHCFKISKIYH